MVSIVYSHRLVSLFPKNIRRSKEETRDKTDLLASIRIEERPRLPQCDMCGAIDWIAVYSSGY